MQAPISAASGTAVRIFNAGEINSKGAEVLLTLRPLQPSSKFDWTSSFNFATSRSEVVELADGIETLVIAQGPSGGTIEARPGGRMGDIYGRGFARSPQGDIIYDVVSVNGTDIVRPRGNSAIQKLGNYNPDWMGSMYNQLEYGPFSLSFLLDVRDGGVFYSRTNYNLNIKKQHLNFRCCFFMF